MVSLQIVAVVALMIFFICLFIFAVKQERKRGAELEKASLEMGFTYTPKATIELPDLRLFEKGHSKKKKNLLTATRNGIKWSIFDYDFSYGEQGVQVQTVAMAQLDRELPKFSLLKKHFYHKVGKIIGTKEIIFEDHPEFSQKYYLQGEDETAIRQLFTSHVIFTITGQLEEHVEAKGNFIIMYTPNIQIKPENLYEFFQKAFVIIDLFRESLDDPSKNENW